MPFSLQDLQQNAGIVFATGHAPNMLTDADKARLNREIRGTVGDAAPLLTAPNAGILSMFTTYVDPRVVEFLVEPMKAGQIFGETKKGSWTDDFLQFPIAESTGETSSYDDFSENGMSGTNVNWETRDTYYYQTIIELGEREVERAGAAKLDWVSRKQISAALTLNKFQNKTYFFGVAGLRNWGILNDPSLLAAITLPTWVAAGGDVVYAGIAELYGELVSQTGGLIDRETPMILLLSPQAEATFTRTNQYNVNVSDQIKKNFPNMEVQTAPEMSTQAGEAIKLIVKSYEGVDTVEPTFTEKMRVHPMVLGLSSWRQKRSQGTVGTIIYRPIMVASALVAI
jgi:hypothetical protein